MTLAKCAMHPEDSITRWIAAVRSGDAEAAEQLWARYFRELMVQARLRMSNVSKSFYDEEDAALSTFYVLWRKLEEGRYGEISDRQDLWNLMLTVLMRKIGRRAKYQSAAKRTHWSGDAVQLSLDELPATSVQELSQECLEMISALQDPNLERVAILKFEGYTNDEIAVRLDRTRRTVQRMLNLIRGIWEKELHPGSD